MKELTIPLGIPDLEIVSQSVDNKGKILLKVKSSKQGMTCHKCGKLATIQYGHAPEITIQHLPILDTPVYLIIKPVRYKCEHCEGNTTTTERYDWCDSAKGISKGLSDYLLRQLIHSTLEDVSKKERVSYKQVRGLVERLVAKEVDWSAYDNLNTLGIDEIALKKGHNDYVTVVSVKTANDVLSVVAVLEGKKKEDLESFLRSIPEPLRKTIRSVCTDMYEGYVNAVSAVLGDRVLIVDRYHVARLYRAKVDTLRKSEMKRLKATLSSDEYSKLEGVMWILRRNHECLSVIEKEKLDLLYRYSPKLKQGHSYALKLTQIFNSHLSRKSAIAKLKRWIEKVRKNKVTCLIQFTHTLEKYMTYIANYFKERKNSGFVEGLNNLIKVIKRRCYGLSKPETLFQRLYIDLQGYAMFS